MVRCSITLIGNYVKRHDKARPPPPTGTPPCSSCSGVHNNHEHYNRVHWPKKGLGPIDLGSAAQLTIFIRVNEARGRRASEKSPKRQPPSPSLSVFLSCSALPHYIYHLWYWHRLSHQHLQTMFVIVIVEALPGASTVREYMSHF
jgi:hypothetical protein